MKPYMYSYKCILVFRMKKGVVEKHMFLYTFSLICFAAEYNFSLKKYCIVKLREGVLAPYAHPGFTPKFKH